MEIHFLGTGSSHGIPVIGCKCDVCQSNNEKDKRLRSAVAIRTKNNQYIIDVGPDFRQQMLLSGIEHIDAVLITHYHKDHTAGLDDLRAFNYLQKTSIPIYGENIVLEAIKREYAYVFSENRYPGTPKMDLNEISNVPFNIGENEIIPIRAFHNKLPIFGFKMGDFAYITDLKTIPDEEKLKLLNLEVLVISALRIEPHKAHLGLDEAIALVKELSPNKTYFTHISHMQYSFNDIQKYLPENVFVAYDNLQITL